MNDGVEYVGTWEEDSCGIFLLKGDTLEEDELNDLRMQFCVDRTSNLE